MLRRYRHPNTKKKKNYHSNRAKYLDCHYIYSYSKNQSEILIVLRRYERSKIGPIDLMLRLQYVCPQPHRDSPSPRISRELLPSSLNLPSLGLRKVTRYLE